MHQKSKENNTSKNGRGSLIIVGTGIQAVRHVTIDARYSIENSDKVLYIVADPITEIWIKKLQPDAESIARFYQEGKDRAQIYSEMVEYTMKHVRQGLSICLALYGHPGVFTTGVTKPVIKIARKEGFRAQILPGISTEDCLYAELDVDPGELGGQSFEATRFLLYKLKFDTFAHLILWQVGIIGQPGYHLSKDPKPGLVILTDYLKQYYDPKHEVVVYRTTPYSICKPLIQRVPLYRLPEAYVDAISTLYVPPLPSRAATVDDNMAQQLGVPTK